jgi:thiamine pyrophosphokinase
MFPKRVVIIANGDLTDLNFYRDLLNPDDYIVCANGGTRHAIALGLKPDLIIGDLDSLEPDQKHKMEIAGSQTVSYPSEKDASDLELAVDHALGMKPDNILIIGALGGKRIDHTYINLMLLYRPLCSNIRASIIDESQEIMLINNELVIEGSRGDYLSLFALTSEASGIVTEGLKFSLKNDSLDFASTRGLSNVFTDSQAKVAIKSGLLLVIKTSQLNI